MNFTTIKSLYCNLYSSPHKIISVKLNRYKNFHPKVEVYFIISFLFYFSLIITRPNNPGPVCTPATGPMSPKNTSVTLGSFEIFS